MHAPVAPQEGGRPAAARKPVEPAVRKPVEPESCGAPPAGDEVPDEFASQALMSLVECLKKVPDARSARGKVYPLLPVLSLVVTGLLTGRRALSGIIAMAVGHGAKRRFNGENRRRERKHQGEAAEPAPWLEQIGLRWRDQVTVPTLQTLIRILGGVKASDLQEAMREWVTGLLNAANDGRWVASVDGKALRGAKRHVLSVFIHDLRLTAMQEEVDGKRNELSTLRDRLAWLLERYPGLWLLCGDAIFSDAKLCDMLKDGGRHWLFQVKANQPQLMAKMERVFAPVIRRNPDVAGEPEKKRRLC